MDILNNLGSIGGIRIVSSEFCLVDEPVKMHIKSRTQSDSYHKRIQKKWLKRFGTQKAPGCYMVQLPMGERQIVAHPSVVDKISELM